MKTTDESEARAMTDQPTKWFAAPMAIEDDLPPIAKHDEILAGLEISVRKGEGYFWGVHDGLRDADGTQRVIAHTGNGPNSEEHAHLIAAAPETAAERDRLWKALEIAINALAPQTRYQKSSEYKQLAISEARAALVEARKP